MAAEDIIRNNRSQVFKGLHTDSPIRFQPEATYRFALNTVCETEQGDLNTRSNEEGNLITAMLRDGYIPLGEIYLGDNEVAIFSVSSDNSTSEIGILDSNANYRTVVNDFDSDPKDKLGFSVTAQIEGIYRLRRGCEKTIYFVDELNKPRFFNFNKVERFKNAAGNWESGKFNLQKLYEDIPNFQKVEVLDSGGSLLPGSYIVVPQYVDDALNPTEWITPSKNINIYNDLTTNDFPTINGSINSAVDYLNFGPTNKAIRVEFSNLDTSYKFYRLAIIETNSGVGTISNIRYTDVIPIAKNSFVYTGQNFLTEGTRAEILQMTDVIENAQAILQFENQLILARTKGQQADLCNLQKYASTIQADCVTKDVNLSDVKDPSNPKNPTCFFGGIGYFPGEIYSFAIVYVFEDGTISSAYHIPGKTATNKTTVFSPSSNTFPMDSNNSINTQYINTNNCKDYWGKDSEGIPLEGKSVRHHRFPLRSDIGVSLVTDTSEEEQTNNYFNLVLSVVGTLKTPVPCPEDKKDCGTDKSYPFTIRVSYKVNGEDFFFVQNIYPATYADGVNNTYNLSLLQNSQYHATNEFTDIKIEETDINGNYKPEYSQWESYFTSKPTYATNLGSTATTVKGRNFKTKILGIKFSNVKVPSLKDTGGKKVVGYYIVRNERTEFDKTILDSAVLLPTVMNEKYISQGLMYPETDKIHRQVFGLVHPEHKFKGKEYVLYDKLIHQGTFKRKDVKYGLINFDDVYDGSSYNKDTQKDNNDDGQTADGSPTSRGLDGWSLNVITRDNIVGFQPENKFSLNKNEIQQRFYLNSLDHKSINDNAKDVYNIAADNKVGIIQSKMDVWVEDIPYMLMYKENLESYSNFRTLPYYKETLNPIYFSGNDTSTTSVFNGDSYVAPMRYVNSIFWNNRVAKRAGRTSFLKKMLGAFLIVLGAILALTGIGAVAGTITLGAGITIVGAGALMLSSGLKMDNYNKAYGDEYDKGLRQTTLDKWVDAFYNYKDTKPYGMDFIKGGAGFGYEGGDGPSDDTIQWIGECISDLWFETSINTALRNHFSGGDSPTYLNSPGRIESGNNSPIVTAEYFGLHWRDSNAQRYPISSLEYHMTRKLLAFDEKRDDNKYYLGAPLGEYYNVNPDYLRTNKEKIYYHLPLEYDCCTDCREEFPHRYYYSQPAFQEELTDNFRVFLPNNYRDLEGETGPIVKLVRFGDTIYIHTKEALWLQPKSYQERVTDQIVSYIGTGSLFEIPPRKIVDGSTGDSAGISHKLAGVKTDKGYFFISENTGIFYQYDGEQLKPKSNEGMFQWFKTQSTTTADKEYYKSNNKEYPFIDNPSNKYGVGYLVRYDNFKQRLLLRKKDFTFNENIYSPVLGVLGNLMVYFPNFEEIRSEMSAEGYNYDGVVNGDLQFSKEVPDFRVEKRGFIENGVYVTREVTVNSYRTDYKTVRGEIKDVTYTDLSWTLSYSLKDQSWVSFHSYLPDFFTSTSNNLYSWIRGNNGIWKHNIPNWYQSFYGVQYPHIIEYVSNAQPDITKIWNHITLTTEAKSYVDELNSSYDLDVTFNKAILYNSTQCSGELNLKSRDDNSENLMMYQEADFNDITIQRRERDWSFNEFRDIRIHYQQPIWNLNRLKFKSLGYIDKELNEQSLYPNKDWTQLESFRDKFLAVRLIFDNFANVKLITYFSTEDEQGSYS